MSIISQIRVRFTGIGKPPFSDDVGVLPYSTPCRLTDGGVKPLHTGDHWLPYKRQDPTATSFALLGSPLRRVRQAGVDGTAQQPEPVRDCAPIEMDSRRRSARYLLAAAVRPSPASTFVSFVFPAWFSTADRGGQWPHVIQPNWSRASPTVFISIFL
jgi:hypothetical protein